MLLLNLLGSYRMNIALFPPLLGVLGMIAAFVVYLSALTSIKFTATQYALFSSLMLLFPKVLAGYSGSIVNQIGYANFYIFTAIIGIPVLILIFWIAKLAPVKE